MNRPVSPLRIARQHVGLSQQELADLAGINRRTVGNLERGRPPALQTALALTAVLGYSNVAVLFPDLAPLPIGPAGGEALAPAADSSVAAAGGPGAAEGER